jgi:hypothetical protein
MLAQARGRVVIHQPPRTFLEQVGPLALQAIEHIGAGIASSRIKRDIVTLDRILAPAIAAALPDVTRRNIASVSASSPIMRSAAGAPRTRAARPRYFERAPLIALRAC